MSRNLANFFCSCLASESLIRLLACFLANDCTGDRIRLMKDCEMWGV
jgi:hypothetical protein